jgi:hypothetical protein
MGHNTILFAIYILGIFEEIEQYVIGAKGLSFIHDISRLVSVRDITEITILLEAYRKAAKAWVDQNAIAFDIAETEAILFLRSKIYIAMTINLNRVKVNYNIGVTR